MGGAGGYGIVASGSSGASGNAKIGAPDGGEAGSGLRICAA